MLKQSCRVPFNPQSDQEYSNLNQFLQGGFYLGYKFVLDCAGVAVLIALALGAARRWSKVKF